MRVIYDKYFFNRQDINNKYGIHILCGRQILSAECIIRDYMQVIHFAKTLVTRVICTRCYMLQPLSAVCIKSSWYYLQQQQVLFAVGAICSRYYLQSALYAVGIICGMYYMQQVLSAEGTLCLQKALSAVGFIYSRLYLQQALYAVGIICSRCYMQQVLSAVSSMCNGYYLQQVLSVEGIAYML